MAGKDAKARKRKLEATPDAAKSKRHRSERKEARVNGHDTDQPSTALTKQGDSQDMSNGLQDGPRELEVFREFKHAEAGWRVSKPMGGRMLDIDPILTDDDRYVTWSLVREPNLT
jgi:NET1-associated nuclear protein 1 (U3 small nucleolar RNA-associated protein 17)